MALTQRETHGAALRPPLSEGFSPGACIPAEFSASDHLLESLKEGGEVTCKFWPAPSFF